MHQLLPKRHHILHIAEFKCQLTFTQALFLGILCNILVCLAIWLCFSARSAHGKILAIIFPITAFVAAGFEHSVANMYFIPMGLMVKDFADPSLWEMAKISSGTFNSLTWGNYFIKNLIPVTLGNIIGGALFGYFVVFPYGFKFFLGFATEYIKPNYVRRNKHWVRLQENLAVKICWAESLRASASENRAPGMSMRREIQMPGRRIKPSNSDLIVARNTSMHYDQLTSSTLSR